MAIRAPPLVLSGPRSVLSNFKTSLAWGSSPKGKFDRKTSKRIAFTEERGNGCCWCSASCSNGKADPEMLNYHRNLGEICPGQHDFRRFVGMRHIGPRLNGFGSVPWDTIESRPRLMSNWRFWYGRQANLLGPIKLGPRNAKQRIRSTSRIGAEAL